ncbi:MAG: right-handed parallel beta-helix repeat-containing protein [Acidimicrobiia bacterium]|nr:right-handed parallel beta-helix repeat-containing protein [Acidimicrobiia bacterium]
MKVGLVIGLLIVVAGLAFWVLRRSAVLPAEPLPEPPQTFLAPSSVPESQCDHEVGSAVESFDGDGIAPGDVVCLLSGPRGPLSVRDVNGTVEAPVVFVNHGGTVEISGDHETYAGIDIRSSSNLVVSGAGVVSRCGAEADEQSCGIIIEGTGRGIAGTERTDHLSIDHVEVRSTSHSGVFIRSAAKNGTTRGDWGQEETRVEHNYIHDTGTEGLYLGSSSYAAGEDPLLRGVVVHANLVRSTGWDGIQVGSAVESCSITANRVVGAGTANEDDQKAGIINNRGSVCDVTGNTILGPAAQGIFVQGNGGNLIANNLVIQPGRLAEQEGDGITINRGSNTELSITVVHNTVVAAPRSGIRFRNDVGDENLVANNLIAAAEEALDITIDSVRVVDNVIVRALDNGGFVDPWESDFRLTSESKAVDYGDGVGVDVDADGHRRPVGVGYDAGAFEYQEMPS